MSNVRKRRRYFVDPKVQGALVARGVRFWLTSMVLMACAVVVTWVFITPGITELMRLRAEMPSLAGALLVASAAVLLVLPIVLLDFVRMTNRFAGPVHRLQREMRRAANGEQVAPVHFRDGDYWQDLADSFNLLLERLQDPAKDSVEIADEEPVGSGTTG